MPEHDAMRLYVYEVEPTKRDGLGTSGWTVVVATDKPDLSDLARLVRLEVDGRLTSSGEDWIGIKSAKLLTVAALDPRIAAGREAGR